MGATNFEVFQKGTDLAVAYRDAVSDALVEYGNDPYNGSISTTDGVYQTVHSPMTKKGAVLYANTDSGNADKWGSARAIPVAEDSEFKLSTVKFSIELPLIKAAVDEWDQPRDTNEWDLREAAFERAFKEYGHRVHDVTLTPKLKTKMIVDAPKGRSVTRYQLVTNSWQQQKLHDTKAQATAAAKTELGRVGRAGDTMRVRAVKYWPDAATADAVTVKSQTVAATADVVVTIATPNTRYSSGGNGEPKVVGWVFYGMAAC